MKYTVTPHRYQLCKLFHCGLSWLEDTVHPRSIKNGTTMAYYLSTATCRTHNNNNNTDPSMPTNYALPRGTVDLESKHLDTLISKRQVQGKTRKGFRFLGRDIHNYIWPRTLWWQSRYAIYVVNNDPPPIESLHSLLMATFLLILHLIIYTLGSDIKRKSSTN